jgi:hypothetical protein
MIAKAAYIFKPIKYLSRVMAKLHNHPDVHLVLFYLLDQCSWGNINDLAIHISNSEYCDELMCFQFIRRSSPNLTDCEANEFLSFIDTNDNAKKIKNDIDNFRCVESDEKYRNILPYITLLMNMYKQQ